MHAQPPPVRAPVALPAVPAPTIAIVQAQELLDPPIYKHAMISAVLMGQNASIAMRNEHVTADEFMNILARVFIFIYMATTLVPGFRHNDLHPGNVNVSGSTVAVLDYGLAVTNKYPGTLTHVQAVTRDCGNWDCWRFLGYALEQLLVHVHYKRAWAMQVIMHIREFLADDYAFSFCMQSARLNQPGIRDALAWGGPPFVVHRPMIGCDRRYQPVTYIGDDETKPMVLPGFAAIQVRLTPAAFVEHFVKPLP